jgi:hypothetical protein
MPLFVCADAYAHPRISANDELAVALLLTVSPLAMAERLRPDAQAFGQQRRHR